MSSNESPTIGRSFLVCLSIPSSLSFLPRCGSAKLLHSLMLLLSSRSGMGFSGFRLDAAKHIQPDDLAQIFGRFRRNMGGTLPEDFVAYLEVIIGGEKDLLLCDKDNSYSFSAYFDRVLEKNGLSAEDIAKIKLWESAYPKEFPICGYWVIPSTRFAIENDCHDDQVSSGYPPFFGSFVFFLPC